MRRARVDYQVQTTHKLRLLDAKTQRLLDELIDLGLSSFASKHIFDDVPHIFHDRESYVDWRIRLAERLQVDPSEVVIVGSAALGFSLNPRKSFRPFGDESDVDVAVVSQHHFDEAWHHLRHLSQSQRSRMRGAARQALTEHRTRHIYFGVVATDRILQFLPFGRKWMEDLSAMSAVPPTESREINARIYRDFHALRSYQFVALENARDARLEILSKEGA